ncbi:MULTISPECIES: septum site-determining protein MinC [Ramlibacter]|uniref:Probable septum site-determining protein MinC n=1 Tax=Ramlibacter pinisoli TaxID=2682844 RepID=A0A6N8IMJ5_9BURK|nr:MULTISPECIES: septum site-determining protein MinC [Ramlibacter]MBA2960571.1 septum site-determining protein MinC [Ramlibacter sp. CGMCC 1.13660]MVQ27902.1 septum site-determining protein MinC [Ramlibacter pinisoli]
MSVALAGRTPATFEIKSATLPLVSLLLKSPDLAALSRELQVRFGDKPDFFDHDALVIDLTPVAGLAVDFAALVALLASHRVHPVAVRGGSAEQVVAARAAGLARADDLLLQSPRVVQEPVRSAPAAAPAPAAPPGALIVDRPLRSGQQVYARGRDLVVMAMVNAGAEVVADGSIHVYAPLRGKAMAGARGHAEARIVTLCLEPELVSIAGVYRTSDVPLPAAVLGKPTQIRLDGGTEGRLVMDPLDIR